MRVLEENVLTVRLKGNKSKQRKTQGKWSKPMIGLRCVGCIGTTLKRSVSSQNAALRVFQLFVVLFLQFPYDFHYGV